VLAERGSSIPVDVYAIAASAGISVAEENLDDDTSGLIAIRGDRAVIAINRAHHPNRKRFSLAHELGHYFLHRDQGKLFVSIYRRNEVSSLATDPREVEANQFASELLMPAETIKRRLDNSTIDPSDEDFVRRLASEFEVSVQAMSIRLTKLGYIKLDVK
jgi:Zn-dependent peptidase ImmA (M78 family)